MSFWGVNISSGQSFTIPSASHNGRLHISQATLGDGLSSRKSVLQCNVGDNAPVLLCSLLPNKLESRSLNLEFEEEEDVVFSVVGPRSIHISGYYIRSSCAHDDKIEEITDDKQPRKANNGSKLKKHQRSATAERELLVVEVSSDDEDCFPTSTGRRKSDAVAVKNENVGVKPADDEKFYSADSKRKSDAVAEENKQIKKSKKKEKRMKEGAGSGPGMSVNIESNDAFRAHDQGGQKHGVNSCEYDYAAAALKGPTDCDVAEVVEIKKKKNKKKKSNAKTEQEFQDIDEEPNLATSSNKKELEEGARSGPGMSVNIVSNDAFNAHDQGGQKKGRCRGWWPKLATSSNKKELEEVPLAEEDHTGEPPIKGASKNIRLDY